MTTPTWIVYVFNQYERAMRRIGVVWLWDHICNALFGPFRRCARRRRAAQLHELADMLAGISPSRSAELHKLADR